MSPAACDNRTGLTTHVERRTIRKRQSIELKFNGWCRPRGLSLFHVTWNLWPIWHYKKLHSCSRFDTGHELVGQTRGHAHAVSRAIKMTNGRLTKQMRNSSVETSTSDVRKIISWHWEAPPCRAQYYRELYVAPSRESVYSEIDVRWDRLLFLSFIASLNMKELSSKKIVNDYFYHYAAIIAVQLGLFHYCWTVTHNRHQVPRLWLL